MDPHAAMFSNATIDKVEGNEFSNSARDTNKFLMNNLNYINIGGNKAFEPPNNAIDYFRTFSEPIISVVCKNNQSRSRSPVAKPTDASGSNLSAAAQVDDTSEENPVKMVDIVPQEPSLLPVASVADRYTRSMLRCLQGYPLYEPQPFHELEPAEYLRNGVDVGSVGFVRGSGLFDFLFNICPSKNALINPPNLPDGFSLETPDHSATRVQPPETRLFQSPITRLKSGEYICEGPEGAVLELPEGAIQDEATNILPFEKLAACYGVQWYEYAMTRGRKVPNGGLYLITSVTKCPKWGIAVFDRPCTRGQGLKFDKKRSLPFGKSTPKYRWKGSRTFPSKVSNYDENNVPNQCVFLRGYKIMIRQDIFNDICYDQLRGFGSVMFPLTTQAGRSLMVTRQPATRIRGGGGTGVVFRRTDTSTTTETDEVILHADFNTSLAHPSDFINDALLNQNPCAKVALTHDDIWCDIMRDNFPKFDRETLTRIARSYSTIIDRYGCISLKSESSHLIAETGTPAVQNPIVTVDNGHSTLTSTHATFSPGPTLPREIIERILLLVDIDSLPTCQLVFNGIIQSSPSLKYFLGCKAAGVIDNPQSPLSYTERLEALEKREDAWMGLNPVFEKTIKINHQPSHIVMYDLTEGNYFLDDHQRDGLYYCRLPSSPQDDPQWNRIPARLREDLHGTLVNFALAVDEHDLMINVMSYEVGNQAGMPCYSIELVLLKFSTGEYHPLCLRPRIDLQISTSERIWVTPKVVGDTLALVVCQDATLPDKLLIFHWKTGHKRLQHEATENAYSNLVFVSPEILLVPNLILTNFEIWRVPPLSSHEMPVQILSLQIPAVCRYSSLFSIKCSGVPSPFLHSRPSPSRPFFPSPENSIIIANLRISSANAHFHRRQQTSYTLIMHRHALLETIQKWTSPSVPEPEDLSTSLTNDIVLHKVAVPDGSVKLGAQSKLVSVTPHSGSPLTPVFADAVSSPIFPRTSAMPATSRYNYLQLKWADWGPPISRWLQVNETQGWRVLNSAGQRYAFLVPNPNDKRRFMVSVADFNPYNYRKYVERFRGAGEDSDSIGNTKDWEEEELERLDHDGVFSEEVDMGLKCAFYNAPDEYDFDVVLMDEERLLGLKIDREGREESIKVLYFG